MSKTLCFRDIQLFCFPIYRYRSSLAFAKWVLSLRARLASLGFARNHRVIIRLEYIFDPKWGWDHVPMDLSSKYLCTLRLGPVRKTITIKNKNEVKSLKMRTSTSKLRTSTSKLRSRHWKWVQVIENEDNYIYFGPDAECII